MFCMRSTNPLYYCERFWMTLQCIVADFFRIQITFTSRHSHYHHFIQSCTTISTVCPIVVLLILIELYQNKGFHLVLIENFLFLCSSNDTKRLKSDRDNSIMNISALVSWMPTSKCLFTWCDCDCDLFKKLWA